MITSPYEKYRQSAVQTSPSQLLVMLFDGAIRFVRAGMTGIEERDYEKTNLNLGKAQNIMSELMVTLDFTYEVSSGLLKIYEYINYLLIQANIKKDQDHAKEALDYLVDLRETWVTAGKMTAQHGGLSNG